MSLKRSIEGRLFKILLPSAAKGGLLQRALPEPQKEGPEGEEQIFRHLTVHRLHRRIAVGYAISWDIIAADVLLVIRYVLSTEL